MRTAILSALLSISIFCSGQSLGLEPEAVLSTLSTIRFVSEGEVILDKLSKDVTDIEEVLIVDIIEVNDVVKFYENTTYRGKSVVEHIRAYSATYGDVSLTLFVTDTEDKSGEYDFYQEVMIVKDRQ